MHEALPQAKALSRLTDLRDPVKIDAADAEILAAVGRNEATLPSLRLQVTHRHPSYRLILSTM